MGCNTSQELKTKDGNSMDNAGGTAGSGDDAGMDASSAKALKSSSSGNHTNHSKSNSIISNGEAKKDALSPKLNGLPSSGGGMALQHISTSSGSGRNSERQCEKAEISELNDMELGEDEGERLLFVCMCDRQ